MLPKTIVGFHLQIAGRGDLVSFLQHERTIIFTESHSTGESVEESWCGCVKVRVNFGESGFLGKHPPPPPHSLTLSSNLTCQKYIKITFVLL